MKRLALAIARDRRDLPDLAGTARFCSRGLAIIHGEAPADVLSPGVATIEAYAALVAAIHERETVLPLRFGSVHDSTSSLDDWLRVRGDEWRSILDDVDGCDEMGLRILLDRPEIPGSPELPTTPADRPGTAYLKRLKARHDISNAAQEQASRLTERIGAGLDGTFRRFSVTDPGPGRERLLSLTYLVPRSSLERFRQAIGPLQTRLPGKLLLTGPWPPYSFACPVLGNV